MNNEPGFIEIILPLFLFSIPCAVLAGLLAKGKDRNIALWVVLTLIPFINFFAFLYTVGATSLRIEKKIDEILEKLKTT